MARPKKKTRRVTSTDSEVLEVEESVSEEGELEEGLTPLEKMLKLFKLKYSDVLAFKEVNTEFQGDCYRIITVDGRKFNLPKGKL